ncbi:MAG TPA: UbiA family prenyltransferase, partial [Ktedonobacterales bacterium]|nr:UbiA family prenyltransferase [Ktedonobacterales bacterium]
MSALRAIRAALVAAASRVTERIAERVSWWARKLLAHLEMTRPYTLFHSGLLAVAGAVVASGGHVSAWRAGLAAVVTICGWEAGLYAGDYYDRKLDAISKPSRPIPSGRVAPREAFLTMVTLIAVGYLASLALGWANLALAMLTTALGIAYSKTFKSHALLGNFDRGVLGVCAVAFGALAAGGGPLAPLLALAALVFFHDAATNLVGAIRDVDGDRVAGYATVPVLYGVGRSSRIAASFAALAA